MIYCIIAGLLAGILLRELQDWYLRWTKVRAHKAYLRTEAYHMDLKEYWAKKNGEPKNGIRFADMNIKPQLGPRLTTDIIDPGPRFVPYGYEPPTESETENP